MSGYKTSTLKRILCTNVNHQLSDIFRQIDANRTVDEVFADVRALFGALPPKEVQKIKRKKKKVVANEEEDEYEFVEFSGQRIVFVLGKETFDYLLLVVSK